MKYHYHSLTVLLNRKAPFVYTKDGESVAKTLWDEIIHELSFARVGDILKKIEGA